MADGVNGLQRTAGILRNALLNVLPEEAFDVDIDPGARAVDVSTDDWTLHLELDPMPAGWLAIDDEPDTPSGYVSAFQTMVGAEAMTALAEADAELDGLLVDAIRALGDPFSVTLATLMHELRRNRSETA